jgi:hypothetical protein
MRRRDFTIGLLFAGTIGAAQAQVYSGENQHFQNFDVSIPLPRNRWFVRLSAGARQIRTPGPTAGKAAVCWRGK